MEVVFLAPNVKMSESVEYELPREVFHLKKAIPDPWKTKPNFQLNLDYEPLPLTEEQLAQGCEASPGGFIYPPQKDMTKPMGIWCIINYKMMVDLGWTTAPKDIVCALELLLEAPRRVSNKALLFKKVGFGTQTVFGDFIVVFPTVADADAQYNTFCEYLQLIQDRTSAG